MIKLTAARWAGAAGLVTAGLAAALPVLPAAAAAATPVATQGMSFSCILSDFGVSTPITISATLAAPARGTVGQPLTVTLTTQPASLPSAVSSQVPALSTITMAAQSAVNKDLLAPPGQQPGGFVPWSAKTGPVSAGAATIPAMTAKATVLPIRAGTALISTTSSITLTPVGTSATYAPMQCDGPAAEADIPITIKNPPMPAPPPPPVKHAGPTYRCLIPIKGAPAIKAKFPMRITATGPAEVSSTEYLAVSVSPLLAATSSMTTSAGAGQAAHPTTELIAVLPVTGAQTGLVRLSGQNRDGQATLHAAGSLELTAAGQDTILRPRHLEIAMRVGRHVLPGLSCSLRGQNDPAGTTFTVAAGAADVSGTPSGAPNTGGGTGPAGGINRALALGGMGALLGGAGITVAALARRRRRPRVTA